MEPEVNRSLVTVHTGEGGFSLVELLVVLLIIGLMTGVAVLSLASTGRDPAELAATRLRSVLELAQEEAQMQGRNLALGFWQRGWRFYQLDDFGKWQPVTGDRLLRPRKLEQGLDLVLQLQGLDVVLAPFDKTHPQIFLLASGETQPFTLVIEQDGKPRRRLIGDAIGNLKVEQVHAP
ncbi:MAG: type II secretion system minor pseudopilin GspH [Gammaproteobacteria bacterium]